MHMDFAQTKSYLYIGHGYLERERWQTFTLSSMWICTYCLKTVQFVIGRGYLGLIHKLPFEWLIRKSLTAGLCLHWWATTESSLGLVKTFNLKLFPHPFSKFYLKKVRMSYMYTTFTSFPPFCPRSNSMSVPLLTLKSMTSSPIRIITYILLLLITPWYYWIMNHFHFGKYNE